MLPNPTRFRIRFGVVYCALCNLASAYCRCGERSPDAPAQDGAESGLAKRIAEVRGKDGR